jgi:hypothetical protein
MRAVPARAAAAGRVATQRLAVMFAIKPGRAIQKL